MLFVLKVLEQLPECLAMSVLSACPADLDHQLDILPASLHHLAIEAAFPSIRCNQSLVLSMGCLEDEEKDEEEDDDEDKEDTEECVGVVTVSPTHAHAVLHAAKAATTALKLLDLRHVPVDGNASLLQLISAACMSPSDIRLSFNLDNVQCMSEYHGLAQIVESLSCNTALTSLSLDIQHDTTELFDLDSLLEALTGLQSLTLSRDRHVFSLSDFPAPTCIVNLLCLTHLCLGPGFEYVPLPLIVCRLTQLQVLQLRGNWRPQLQELPSLSPLTALKTLELQVPWGVELLPPLATLTALQARLLTCSIATSLNVILVYFSA
jgi:hypothetical protein